MSTGRPLARILLRGAVLAGVAALAAVPVYVYVEPWWRALVARLVAAFALGITLLQLRRELADQVEAGDLSPLDEARARRGPEPAVPHRLRDLTGDVRAALRSRRYFDEVLWPRLLAFTSQAPPRPTARRGRGPGLAALRAVITAIERRP